MPWQLGGRAPGARRGRPRPSTRSSGGVTRAGRAERELRIAIRRRFLELAKALQAEHGYGAIFISHDLAATRYVVQRILVMRNGSIEHEGDAESFYRPSANSYTRRLQLASDL